MKLEITGISTRRACIDLRITHIAVSFTMVYTFEPVVFAKHAGTERSLQSSQFTGKPRSCDRDQQHTCKRYEYQG